MKAREREKRDLARILISLSLTSRLLETLGHDPPLSASEKESNQACLEEGPRGMGRLPGFRAAASLLAEASALKILSGV